MGRGGLRGPVAACRVWVMLGTGRGAVGSRRSHAREASGKLSIQGQLNWGRRAEAGAGAGLPRGLGHREGLGAQFRSLGFMAGKPPLRVTLWVGWVQPPARWDL